MCGLKVTHMHLVCATEHKLIKYTWYLNMVLTKVLGSKQETSTTQPENYTSPAE